MTSPPDRDQLASDYFDALPYPPYPVQEEALLAWFTSDQGVLVCAPTGTGKTMIAEAAVYEALHSGHTCYYTTPLIALTEQKFDDLQAAAVRWGFSADDVGLVTGNRRVNADAPILVVVAEILLNRLLHTEAFDFADCGSVVMDEFHSFNDYERGIVWELSLGLLPKHVRTLLLSATVGNSYEFTRWLERSHDRNLQLVESSDRKVPLRFNWVGDQLLNEQIETMASGDEESRRTPALIFAFNRDGCWTIAEQLKGKNLISDARQKELVAILDEEDMSQGAGPKLRQLLLRGVGVHHAGILPKYRRLVESLYQRKLLSVAVCTETLSAGINLPARSVVLPSLLKGPRGRKKVVESSSAKQIFGRAGRPQFDSEGFVYALAHEDDVKIARWKEKYDQIPEDTPDPGLRKAKKQLKKKQPKRRSTEQYWNEDQFWQLRDSPSAKLSSRGPLPWRLLVYMLDASSDITLIRDAIRLRLLDPKQTEVAQKALDRMLITLHYAGYVELEPRPPAGFGRKDVGKEVPKDAEADKNATAEAAAASGGLFAQAGLNVEALKQGEIKKQRSPDDGKKKSKDASEETDERNLYRPEHAHPTELLHRLLCFRSINPVYGVYLVNQLGIASREERLQALESVLELPGSVAHFVRVPSLENMPLGPLATDRLNPMLLDLGLVSAEELGMMSESEDDDSRDDDERRWPLTLAEKLKLLFEHEFPGVDVRTQPVWAAGEVLEFGGNFNKYVTTKKLQKQEGIVFRHLLRLILMLGEIVSICPPDMEQDAWEDELYDLRDQLTECCTAVDPQSTEQALETVTDV